MAKDMKDDLWQKLESINEAMGRVRSLTVDEQWDEAQELLQEQEKECRQFTRWLEGRLSASQEPDETVRHCCHTLQSLQALVVELQGSFSRRRGELLESLADLNEQDRAAKRYGGPNQEASGPVKPEHEAHQVGAVGSSRSNGASASWSPRRLALYK